MEQNFKKIIGKQVILAYLQCNICLNDSLMVMPIML